MKTTFLLVVLSLLTVGCDQGSSQQQHDDLLAENQKIKSELEALQNSLSKADSYLGFWQRADREGYQIIEIFKDGATYLFAEDMEQESVRDRIRPTVLEKRDGQLGFSSGDGGWLFGLSEDNNKLFISDRSYKKISTEQVNEIKAIIMQQKLSAEQERIARKNQLEENIKHRAEEISAREKKQAEDRLAQQKQREENAALCKILKAAYKDDIEAIKQIKETDYKKWSAELKKIKQEYRDKQKTIRGCIVLI